MPDLPISGLPTVTTPGSADLLALVQSGTTSQITYGNLISGVGRYDASVGATGADFTTLSAAVAAGNTNIVVINSTTETADTAVPAGGLFIAIDPGASIGMGTNQFTYSANANVTVVGPGEIDYAYTVQGNPVFDTDSFTDSILTLNNVVIDNNSTVGDTPIADAASIHYIDGCIFELPNQQGAHVRLGNSRSFVINSRFIGGGANCFTAIIATFGVIHNCFFQGTFSSSGRTVDIGGSVVASQIRALNDIILDNDGGRYTDFQAQSTAQITLTVGANGSTFDNGNIRAGSIDIGAFDNCNIIGIESTGSIDLTDTGAQNLNMVGCRITGAATIGGDSHKFTACNFLGGVTVNSGADNNSFSNCQIGADAGGGANTITVASGATNTRIVGCMTDADISNSDASTVSIGNVTY